jgi:NAD dependent epimerase/dehydratase family enzyme
MLAEVVGPFRMGAGGPMGTGRQGVSWIHIDDLVYALWMLIHEPVQGPVNMTAPTPVSQRDYATTLGNVLGRPAIVPAPAFAVRAMFGEMGEATILEGQFVSPGVLTGLGYDFAYPELADALRAELG